MVLRTRGSGGTGLPRRGASLMALPLRAAEKPDYRHRLLLLRMRGERPPYRAAEQRDEVAGASLDHLVGEREQVTGDCDAERLGSLEVDHELEPDRLHDRQVGRIRALEHAPGVDSGLTKRFRPVGTVTHEAAGRRELAPFVHGRDRVPGGQSDKLFLSDLK